MGLKHEIDRMSLGGKITSDRFSVGEVLSLFRQGEIQFPDGWQERHIWTVQRKSALIESLLLRIPVSAFYFACGDNGELEIQDGVARVATILEFAGELPDGQGGHVPSLRLSGTNLVPSLEGLVWASQQAGDNTLPMRLRFDFRRPQLTAHILDRTASSEQRDCFETMASIDRSPDFPRSPSM